ncbi:NAD(P)/FAD-dependent oxidoreductase [Vagococcus coleopterorum]|uniref:Ferredoxin--NADP reductase n=1 Tax=Vagococcus coleopterorum TaxID=2714946 RepID=A0A6G8APR7_9ENTE|nr:NAD(P)/FAD-dependent oxidoreductase [Vagococcus coleopterorum]QIL46996.1 NAD(P)/FAD-dependent oxidoreductase [Vagococcus coleopterorum]
MVTNKDIYDLTIIGGGPAGLFAGFYAGMRQAKTKIIESLPQLGGQLTLLYPEKKIYDIPGFPNIPAADLIENLSTQMAPFNHDICLNEEVLEINKLEDGSIHLKTNLGDHYSKAVIITAGNGAFQPRKLQVPYEEKLEGQSLHYFVTNTDIFTNKDVVICGGGDSAVDWALTLEPIANSVSLLHRRDAFRAHEHSLALLEKSSVEKLTPYVIKEIDSSGPSINNLTIVNPKTAEDITLTPDHLLVTYGFMANYGELSNWGLELDGHAIKVNSDMSTNIPGIYAAGDICTYPGKVKLIATGFGEAPTAVNNALHFISPETRTQPAHSTAVFND